MFLSPSAVETSMGGAIVSPAAETFCLPQEV
jgi:hypothetical protein